MATRCRSKVAGNVSGLYEVLQCYLPKLNNDISLVLYCFLWWGEFKRVIKKKNKNNLIKVLRYSKVIVSLIYQKQKAMLSGNAFTVELLKKIDYSQAKSKPFKVEHTTGGLRNVNGKLEIVKGTITIPANYIACAKELFIEKFNKTMTAQQFNLIVK